MPLFLLSACITMYSCSKENSDNVKPTLEILSVKEGDIFYTDSIYGLKAHFTDNEALSSYSIKIWNSRLDNSNDTTTLKSIKEGGMGADSAFFNKAFQSANIFNKKDTTINIFNAFYIDSVLSVSNRNYPILLGEHFFKVTVVDQAGNLNADSLKIIIKKRQ